MYRSGGSGTDFATGVSYDYTRKEGVLHSEIMTPGGVPVWTHDREQLWNEVEKAEKRKDAQLAREYELALPCELTLEENKALLREWIGTELVGRGMIVDWSVHDGGKGDQRNFHVHALATMREVGPDGFGKKNRSWNDKRLLQELRAAWAEHCNRHLEFAGRSERIDHRSLRDQGSDRIPGRKVGVAATGMERKKIKTERGDLNREVSQLNKELTAAKADILQLAVERERLQQQAVAVPAREVPVNRRSPGVTLPGASQARVEAPPAQVTAGRVQRIGGDRREVLVESVAGGEILRDGHEWKWANSKKTAFRDRGDTLEAVSTGQIAIAGMIEVAKQKGWTSIEVTGEAKFSREVWLQARLVGLQISGYEPSVEDLAELRMRADASLSRPSSDGLVQPAKMVRRAPARSAPARDRTVDNVRRQLDGMACDRYELAIHHEGTGKTMYEVHTRDELLEMVPRLKALNAGGNHIWISPAKSEGLALVDDVRPEAIAQIKADGLAVACVVETSPGRHQAWVRLDRGDVPEEFATEASRILAEKYGGDPGSVGWRHKGRLAGFTNQKPERTTDRGQQPYSMCRESNAGGVSPRGAALLAEARERLQRKEIPRHDAPRYEIDAGELISIEASPALVAAYREARARGPIRPDRTLMDYRAAVEMLVAGYSPAQVATAMKVATPGLEERKRGHVDDYVRRTVEAAGNDPRVQQAQSEQQTPKRPSAGPPKWKR